MPGNSESIKTKRKKFAFKGLVRRKSRKNQDNVSKSKRVIDDDELSTAYSVRIDAGSKFSQSEASSALDTAKTLTEPINVILLLMDPDTRRFELLQLEFDGLTAKVEDIFAQIATSATEPSLRSETFTSLCNLQGEDMEPSYDLSEYIDSAGIIIAVPSSTNENSEKIAKMASPILANPKVHNMLTLSGLDIPDLPEAEVKQVEKEIEPKSEPVTKFEPDLAPEVQAEPVSEPAPKPVSEPAPKPVPEPTPEVVTDVRTEIKAEMVRIKDAKKTKAIPQPAVEKKVASCAKTPCAATNFVSKGAFGALVAFLTLQVNTHYTSPLSPGSKLAPGSSRGMCGLKGFDPRVSCESSTIIMGLDGVLTVIREGEVVYEVQGKTCDGKEDCVDGLEIDKEGKIKIGGEKVTTKTKGTIDLRPWPFTDDVTIPKTLF